MKPTLNFVEAIKACFNKYATFSGRARRSEFWWFYLLQCILGWVYTGIMQARGGVIESAVDYVFLAIYLICYIALLIPGLAVWCRRLHDVGKSGKNLLWILACGIGGLIPLIMAIPDGNKGANQYGEDPKE